MSKLVQLPPDMPEAMASLPRDEVGRPVPYFVEYVDGKPDFRVMNARHFRKAIMEERCWVCGRRMHPGSMRVFVAGPMCLINGTSAEPPSHMACAEWSARACPFLVNPHKRRRDGNLPVESVSPGGIMLDRNPGVTALIGTHSWWAEQSPNGVLCKFDKVREVRWLAEGREATLREVTASIETGMPTLAALAKQEGQAAVLALAKMYSDAIRWLPSEEQPHAPA